MTRVEPGERAALYFRVSTEEQERQGYSLDAQRDSLIQYAKENMLKIVGEFRDGGFSARKKWKTRPAFVALLDAVERDEVDVILFIKLDRWFRNISDYYEVQRILDAHNVRWVAIMEDYDTTTASGRLNLNIRLTIAQDEADRTSERIKFVFADKLRRGEVLSGSLPIGFSIVDKKPVINEDADLAREIFGKYIALRSAPATVRWLLEEKGIRYSINGLRKMLTNRCYIGEWNGIKGFSESIIDEATFQAAQDVFSQRAQRHGASDRVYLFSGIIFCASCKRKLGARTNITSVGENVYYYCVNHTIYHDCECPTVNEKQIERFLLDNLLDKVEQHNVEISNQSKNPRKDKTASIKAKMERLKELYINDLLDIESYRRDYNALKTQLEEEQKKNDAVTAVIPLSSVQEPLTAYGGFSRSAKKAFWSTLISRIEIGNKKEITFDLR